MAFSVIGQCLFYRLGRPITERLIGPGAFGRLDAGLPDRPHRRLLLAALGLAPPIGGGRTTAAAGRRAAMTWIALKMLTGDKAKFFGIVLGLTFAALLITQQGSIFCGLMCRTAGQIYDITGADLWVMDPNVRFIDDVKPMIETNLYRVRGVEGVAWAVPLYKGVGRAKVNSTGDDGERHEVIEQVVLLGLDDAALVGAPPPERILAGRLVDLRRPDAVVVDFTRLGKLFPGEDWGAEPARPGLGRGPPTP